MPPLDLRDAWRDVLARRQALAGSLALYTRVVDAWATTTPAIVTLTSSAAECRRYWRDGLPVLAMVPPMLEPAAVEELLGVAMEALAESGEDVGEHLQRLAEAWDRGEVTPHLLLPAPGRIGALEDALGLGADMVAFLATATLRPSLEVYLEDCRDHLRDGDWDLGVCPFCGAPPGFADIVEDGRRRLACHVCGGNWGFSRLRCPFCGNSEAKDLGRLELEAPADQGYFISICRACQGYLKELDRRVRWNGGPPLLEDWASPHFDLAASGRGLGRPLAPVVLARRTLG